MVVRTVPSVLVPRLARLKLTSGSMVQATGLTTRSSANHTFVFFAKAVAANAAPILKSTAVSVLWLFSVRRPAQ